MHGSKAFINILTMCDAVNWDMKNLSENTFCQLFGFYSGVLDSPVTLTQTMWYTV